MNLHSTSYSTYDTLLPDLCTTWLYEIVRWLIKAIEAFALNFDCSYRLEQLLTIACENNL